MPLLSPSLPKVSLRREQWVRLIVVGFFAALAVVAGEAGSASAQSAPTGCVHGSQVT
jgi:hypothetical protein